MADYGKIKTFVQKTLGCGCPEEVFNSINYLPDVKLGDITLKSRINIGNRLLVYIVDIDNPDLLKKNLTILIAEGKKDRDSFGMNRLRLVIVSDINDIHKHAYSIFNSIVKDEKVHLHVISKNNLPEF